MATPSSPLPLGDPSGASAGTKHELSRRIWTYWLLTLTPLRAASCSRAAPSAATLVATHAAS